MGVASATKRRRTPADPSFNSVTPSRTKPTSTGRGRGRPPSAPRDGRERPPPLAECFRKRCNDVLDRLSKKDHYNIFLEPVNTDVVAGYADIIKRPMDFTTMRNKLSRQEYKSLGEFRKDLDLIWSNCLLFNGKEPTNIFSKKAIELRRLTEKLIVTTRQYLEKDKENLLKWKEKHRKRKETMQANAANAQAALHAHTIGNPSLLAPRDPRTLATPTPSDHMDRDPNEFAPEDHNGKSPEQTALAESLRLQYAGTTGLYKKSVANAPFPQYTKPDGSIVQIPLRRYHPEEDHWAERRPPSEFHVIRADNVSTLTCDSLPSASEGNSCQPHPNMDHILVQDYAESLYNFFRGTDMEHVGLQIVTELLSPELAVKRDQEELVRKGFNLKDLENKARIAAARNPSPQARTNPPKYHWDAQSIIKLADDIEKANRRVVSMLPKLLRPINELDGISGLERLLGRELSKEVDDVPAEVVDFAMPHGVSLSTMSEICRLQSAPAIQLSANDLQCVETLRKSAQDHLARIGPAAAAKLSGASVRTSAQLHEIQVRAIATKQQWRHEAVRQASLIEERLRGAGANSEDPSAAHRKELELSFQNAQRTKIGDARQWSRQTPQALPSKRTTESTTAELEKGINVALNEMQSADKNGVCQNCGTHETVGLRIGGVGLNSVERLCIPCGLYWQKTNRHRPKELWAQLSQSRVTPHAASPAMSISTIHRGTTNVHQSVTSNLPLHGVTNHPIHKDSKSGQMHAKRSPSSSSSRGKVAKPRIPSGMLPLTQGIPLQNIQAASPVGNSFILPNAQVVTARGHNVTQLYPKPISSMDTRDASVVHSMQQMQGMNRPGLEPIHKNAHAGLPTAAMQQHLQARMGQMMYNSQQPGAVGITSQLLAMASRGHPHVAALQRQAFMQQGIPAQHVIAASIPTQSSVPPFSQQVTAAKTSPMMTSVNGNVARQIAPSPQISAVARNAASKEMASQVIPQITPQVQPQAQIQIQTQTHVNAQPRVSNGHVSIVPERSGAQTPLPEEMVITDIPSFINNGSGSSATLGNLGEAGTQNVFGASNGGSASEGLAQDQMGDVDDMFFADGAIDGPTGSPDFGF